ncbi:hypothetical protein CEUSTIGMA_g5866.t1 [Chlamydomonas eustigma]|uniref:Uncharacterized protein n=1 Tax=Chlamydomonas eustigma TaxID=1157962 RepID=A0A250X5R5_9CHLO|nr:hypothetical protein CEUSTIGMA_g5866.t1 [Chlamydomonas eustigma]|eukprot:GAX78425.1 hypothetical protein CEUSTIGMA_g5866.t1 [Chlamydomonas eustigma]
MSFDEQRTIMNHHHLCKPGPSNGPDHQVHLLAGPQAVFFSSTDSTNIPASIAPAGVTTYANPYIRDSAYMKWQQFAASHQKRLPTKKDRDERLLHDLAIWAKQKLQKFGDGLEIYRSSSQPYDAIPFVAAIAAGLKMPLHNNLPERVPQIRNHLRAHSGDKEVMARGDKHKDALDKELLEVESNISTFGMEKITSLIIVRSIEE